MLKATKKSTASLGKFDDKLKGEGREKHVKRKVGVSLSTSATFLSFPIVDMRLSLLQFDANEVSASEERQKALSILTSIGATPSNKRTRVSDDAPNARQETKGLVNERKAIKKLTGGRGALSLEQQKGGKKGSRK